MYLSKMTSALRAIRRARCVEYFELEDTPSSRAVVIVVFVRVCVCVRERERERENPLSKLSVDVLVKAGMHVCMHNLEREQQNPYHPVDQPHLSLCPRFLLLLHYDARSPSQTC
jgi:hypothetical protein